MSNTKDPCDSPIMEDDTSSVPYWNWFGIEVGKSTLTDLISMHGEPIFKQPFAIKSMEGCIYKYQLSNVGPVFFISIDSRIHEIVVYEPSYLIHMDKSPLYLGEIVKLYGNPDLVGFNGIDSEARIVVWPNHGVQASVRIGYKSSIGGTLSIDINKAVLINLAYFTPISSEKYINSFHSISGFSESLPQSDVIDAYPRDPFNWDN